MTVTVTVRVRVTVRAYRFAKVPVDSSSIVVKSRVPVVRRVKVAEGLSLEDEGIGGGLTYQEGSRSRKG